MSSIVQSVDLLEHRLRRWWRGTATANAKPELSPSSSSSSVASPALHEENVETHAVAKRAETKSPVSPKTTTALAPAHKPYVSQDTWGCLGHLTKEQEMALATIKKHFAHKKCNDPAVDFTDERFLLRFLRACVFLLLFVFLEKRWHANLCGWTHHANKN